MLGPWRPVVDSRRPVDVHGDPWMSMDSRPVDVHARLSACLGDLGGGSAEKSAKKSAEIKHSSVDCWPSSVAYLFKLVNEYLRIIINSIFV